ncbi:MAG: type II toxin-antitoxin system HicB family antitoxin [Spirosomaceae bacterium]|jgi:predicted RNase H-like HicB family nuclease|nr:type II toxin-antitoxin system HicB family antitoxin [Spirosomataceae bacterium]
MKYLVIIEPCEDGGYSAYVPDLPVCFSVGGTLEETKANIKEAIELYLDELKEEGKSIPIPSQKLTELIEIAA